METIFLGKNKTPYLIRSLSIDNIANYPELLTMYSMSELHELYIKYYGDYSHNYPYILCEKIKLYDTSGAVNSFIIGDKTYWLDKATRVGLMHLANCSTESVELALDDQVLAIPVDYAKDFLARLEVYAGKCYLQTQKHLTAVKNLTNVEDILNYDYTTGYPEKITF